MAKNSGRPGGVRTAPDPMLLALVAQFLENNGFNSAHRIYNTERKKRPKKEGWQGTFAKSYTAGVPPLETIFQKWQLESSKLGSGDSEDESDEENSGESQTQKSSASKAKGDRKGSDSTSDSESSSADDSDEDESKTEDKHVVKFFTPASIPSKALKRKAPSISSDSDSESSTSDSKSSSKGSESESDDVPPAKRQRRETSSSSSNSDSSSDADSDSDSSSGSGSSSKGDNPKLEVHAKSASDRETSSSSDESDSAASSNIGKVTVQTVSVTEERALSDSSGTITGDVKMTTSDDQGSIDEAVAVTKVVVTKKHTGAQPTRLAQMSANADLNEFVSNNYVSYDYADKAYRDLSITRGKGFTKEKNKKKRGSYRGGAIDISGGKGFKFDE